MEKTYQNYCDAIQQLGRLRNLNLLPKKKYLDFSTNDYLNLSQHPSLITAATKAVQKYGVGATGSRLLSGNKNLFTEFEQQIAKDKKTEAALIVNSGFQTNATVLSALLDQSVLKARPLVFFDKLNHASLYHGVFISNAELIRYRHNDMQHLTELLNNFTESNRPKFMIAETLFGMDGDVLPINDFLQLARAHQAFVYLDEAHAVGILGNDGYGLSTTVDFTDIPHLIMGTFSKALGCFGAYVACSNVTKTYLANKATGIIYSTALPPMLVAVAKAAWSLLPSLATERAKLLTLASKLRMELQNLGFKTGNSTTHIVPIILGDEERTMKAKDALAKAGILVSAVRPPTVPSGTSRLRIALTLEHDNQDINALIMALDKHTR